MLQQLGKFKILRQLGHGAMGEVYLGQDPAIGREVAIKTIRSEAAQGPEARERFAREAQAAGTLNHPNLVTIHEFGEDQGMLYLAMEYVPGSDLGALFRERALAPVDLLEVLAQVCDGLAYAHARGVLHRDIKPSNIRVHREGAGWRAKVMDFGVARMEGSELTSTGTILGTFGYMAPEYIRNGAAEARSDLFAVGVMLYEGLSGRRPFEGDTTATILYRVVHEDPAPLDPADLRGVSPKLGSLLARALAKDPRNRFRDAETMAQALRAAKDPAWTGPAGEAATVARPRPAMPTSAPSRKPAVRPPWSLLLLLAAGALGAWAYHTRSRPRLSPEGPAPHAVAAPSQAPPPADSEASGAEAPTPISAPSVPPPRASAPPRPDEAQPTPPPPEAPPAPPDSQEEGGFQAQLTQAAQSLRSDPAGSLAAVDRVLAERPDQPRARALRLVALYQLGRDGAFHRELEDDRARGLDPSTFLRFEAFRDMLREERQARRLPREDRRLLRPAGPGEGRGPWRNQGPSGD